MSNKLPEIPPLTKDQLHRLLTADWLESIARMIRKGQITEFDLAWDLTLEKPEGRVAVDPSLIIGPLEARITYDIEVAKREAAEEAARKIPVIDATEHEQPCNNQACIVCHNPNKA